MNAWRRLPSSVLATGALCLLAAACTPSKDCRYAEWACAPSFQCLQAGGGAWECSPLVSAAPAPAVAPPKSLPPKAPGPCTGRPPCRKDALECTCDGQDRLLTTVFDGNKDGVKDECARYTYPSPTRVLVEVDQGCDGSMDVLHTHELDAAGNEILWASEQKVHPEKTLYRRYLYELGALVATETAQGKPDNVIQRCDYQPPCQPPIPNPTCKPVCRKVMPPPTSPETAPEVD
ncbi:MAG TPA: hypothetical protein PK668_20705 [Myxococcota bacterium]|nr:hypothetical protein [Myxococcota bacterium]HRY96667.1 hypothetical protein [Myxococcota bacterium]